MLAGPQWVVAQVRSTHHLHHPHPHPHPHVQVSCTCVRIPTLRAHGESITIETEKKIDMDRVYAVLNEASVRERSHLQPPPAISSLLDSGPASSSLPSPPLPHHRPRQRLHPPFFLPHLHTSPLTSVYHRPRPHHPPQYQPRPNPHPHGHPLLLPRPSAGRGRR